MTTWGVQLTTLEQRAAEHEKYARDLTTQLADPVSRLQQRCEELRKQHSDYAAKLEKEKESQYGDLKKEKGKYDDVCEIVEKRRKKIESSYDSSKSKAQNAYQQQQQDMYNAKVCRPNVLALRRKD
jgi:chromosome segregation ATPase